MNRADSAIWDTHLPVERLRDNIYKAGFHPHKVSFCAVSRLTAIVGLPLAVLAALLAFRSIKAKQPDLLICDLQRHFS